MNTRLCTHTGAIDLIATLIARKVQFAVAPLADEYQVSWPEVRAQAVGQVLTEYPSPPNGPRAA